MRSRARCPAGTPVRRTGPGSPAPRGAAIRSSMCSTTCSAVARPKRASSAAGIRSVFSIVPVASSSVTTAPDAFDSRSVSVLLALVVRVVEHPDLDRCCL